ncbi:MAG: DUF2252 domain-containing protein, partial [Deltaproteobacteria bacterium]|nr:DUF2252 domain-containing protein [Deltaproteobacteria bacterium]
MHRGWALLAILLGCSSSAGPRDSKPRASKKSSANPMAIDETPADFKDNPRLLSRLLSGPHGYFRFVNIKFATEVCRRFDKDLIGSPAVNLHGDAHVEQYAVTDLGRGLTDFDDASRGPAIVDLTRFGVSILLAAEANGWAKHGPRLIGRFLDGYRDALADPKLAPPIPAVAARFLGSFREDRQAALVAADDLMDDLDFAVEELQSAIDRYAKPLGDSDLNLRGSFFKIKRAGKLHIGIGSALDSKYLLRVEGPSTSPDDDVVLEVKEVRKLNAIPCLNSNWTNDPFRILVGSARIAYRPFRYLGYTVLSGQAYWVHAWT